MHPHGVKYNPEYDGVLPRRLHARGRLHRARRRSSPTRGRRRPTRSASGPTTTTAPTTRSTPSAGCSARSSCASSGAKVPDVEAVAVLALARAARHRPRAPVPVHQRPRLRRQHADVRAKVGQDVAIHVFGDGRQLPHFHIHGHRWKDPSGSVRRHPRRRAQRDGHRPLHRGQPGPLALPLPRLHPPGRWDGGLVPGRALRHRRRRRSHDAGPHDRPGPGGRAWRCRAAALAGRLPAAGQAVDDPEAAEGPVPHAHACASSGCKYTTIQSAVNKAKAGDTVKVKQRHLPRGRDRARAGQALPQAHRQPQGTRRRSSSTARRARRRRARTACGSTAPTSVTIDGFTAKHYKGNGFFVVNVTGYTLNHLQRDAAPASTASTPSTRSAATMENSAGVLEQRLGLLHRPDAARRPRPSARSSATSSRTATCSGFSGTNMRYVTITKSQWFNNGTGHRPQRAGHREVRAAGGQRHHRQRHLLEQLQLLRGRAVQAARSRRRATPYPVGVGVLLFGGRRDRGREQPRSTATTWSGSARSSRSCSSRPTRPTSIGNQVHDNAVRARRRRPQRPRPVLRRQRHRTTASGPTSA